MSLKQEAIQSSIEKLNGHFWLAPPVGALCVVANHEPPVMFLRCFLFVREADYEPRYSGFDIYWA